MCNSKSMDNRYDSPDMINDAVHALQAIGKLIDVDLDVSKALPDL